MNKDCRACSCLNYYLAYMAPVAKWTMKVPKALTTGWYQISSLAKGMCSLFFIVKTSKSLVMCSKDEDKAMSFLFTNQITVLFNCFCLSTHYFLFFLFYPPVFDWQYPRRCRTFWSNRRSIYAQQMCHEGVSNSCQWTRGCPLTVWLAWLTLGQ